MEDDKDSNQTYFHRYSVPGEPFMVSVDREIDRADLVIDTDTDTSDAKACGSLSDKYRLLHSCRTGAKTRIPLHLKHLLPPSYDLPFKGEEKIVPEPGMCVLIYPKIERDEDGNAKPETSYPTVSFSF
jgi:hypothetical protein